VAQWVDADGTVGQIEYTVSLDGSPSPVTGYPNADTVEVKTGKGNWLHVSLLKRGKPVEWGRYNVSADGKTLHATEGGSDEKGTKYRWVEVFDRQWEDATGGNSQQFLQYRLASHLERAGLANVNDVALSFTPGAVGGGVT
jgi:hypothetical protein